MELPSKLIHAFYVFVRFVVFVIVIFSSLFLDTSIASPNLVQKIKVKNLVGGQFLSFDGKYLQYTVKDGLSFERIKIFHRDLTLKRTSLISSGVFGPASMSWDGKFVVFRGGNGKSVVLFNKEQNKGEVLKGDLISLPNGNYVGPFISESGEVISYLTAPKDSTIPQVVGDLIFYFPNKKHYLRFPVYGDDLTDISYSRSGLSFILERETLSGKNSLITNECFQITDDEGIEENSGLFCERQSSKIVGKNSLSEEAFFAMLGEQVRFSSSLVQSKRLVDNVGVSEGVYIPKNGKVITSPFGKGVSGPSYSELGDIVVFLTDAEPTQWGEETQVENAYRFVMMYDLAGGYLDVLDIVRRAKGEKYSILNSSFLTFAKQNIYTGAPVISGNGKYVAYVSGKGSISVLRR